MTQQSTLELIQEKPKRDGSKKGGLSAGSWVLLSGIVFFGLVIGWQLNRSNFTAQTRTGIAPDFAFVTFDDQEMSLVDLRGKVVVLNFWASWCGPCRLEAPELQAAWEEYAPGGEVVFLGIAYADNGPESLAFLEEYEITYLNAPDLGTRISDMYHIQGVPETFIIGKDGNIEHFIYAGVTMDDLMAVVDPLLEAGS